MMQSRHLVGLAAGAALVAGCGNNEQLDKARAESVQSAAPLVLAAGELQRLAGGEHLGYASFNGTAELRRTLGDAVQWKAALDAGFTEFTNSLNAQIVISEAPKVATAKPE